MGCGLQLLPPRPLLWLIVIMSSLSPLRWTAMTGQSCRDGQGGSTCCCQRLPQLPSGGLKGAGTRAEEDLDCLCCGNGGWWLAATMACRRRRMEVVMVWWQVAIKKVLKPTIHCCFEALCTGRGAMLNPDSANAVASHPQCALCHNIETFTSSLVKGMVNARKGGGRGERGGDEGSGEKWRQRKWWFRQTVVCAFSCFFQDCEFIVFPPD